MSKKKIVFFFLILFFICVSLIFFFKDNTNKESEIKTNQDIQVDEGQYSSNIINNIKYVSKDTKGNEYIIEASKGEIDYSNPDVIFLENVKAVIKLNNSKNITISSDFGKYNSNNYDTIFTKNVIINYLNNKITGEYLDFSLNRNSMVISKKVTYSNENNILKSDIIEINIETKDTKIFMYEDTKKVNIKSKNQNGNN